MRLSSLADYAVVIMSAASRHCGKRALDASDNKGVARISASELAEETGIPLPTVQKLVSKLSHAGLLRSTRGAAGGLKLARPAAAISLADIVEAVEGPIAMTSCIKDGDCGCVIEPDCSVKPHWPVVNAAVRGALAGVPLTSLVGAAA
jgi:FeS assembly SUF system regulator